jgi:diguanylate cyclase (GGDEF)-like protein
MLQDEVTGVGVVFIDLDGFKLVNDTHGHETGDSVLVAVGQRLSASARASDLVVRWGGDEFVIVCLGVDEERAHEIAARAITALEAPVPVEHAIVQITASAGVVTANSRVTTMDLLDAADSAMYRAKRAGKGRVSD